MRAAAVAAVEVLGAAGRTVASAESLTGGLLGAALTSVPGSSKVYRGGVVAYATDLKQRLLGVDAELLARVGAVDPDVARGMAEGVRDRLGADYGVATTGVAGPEPQDGQPPGTVWLGLAGPAGSWAVDVSCAGTRSDVRLTTTATALSRLVAVVSAVSGEVEAAEPKGAGGAAEESGPPLR
ncbi:MAG TPA: CinA family protein [Actinomycetales bacterium]|nr:CinA family protein [Actinomycetales bacterium]